MVFSALDDSIKSTKLFISMISVVLSFKEIVANVSAIWVGVVFGVRSYLPWKTLKRRRDAEYNPYLNAYLYWLLPPVFSHI